MADRRYIQVVLPLRLEWEPWYYTTGESLHIGDRILVRLSGRSYIAVVSAVDGTPDIDPARISPIESTQTGLEPVTPEEIRFWRFLSEYYLCTLGEVYKAAYPASLTQTETRKASGARSAQWRVQPKAHHLSEAQKRAVTGILDAFAERRPALLEGYGREAVYDELARRTAAAGRDTVILRPGTDPLSYTQRREAAKALRGPEPVVCTLGRNAVLLPYRKLGLIIVDEEQDSGYKRESPAPRFQARDAALMLARIHGADVVLGSGAPSLESLHNALTGKYAHVFLPRTATAPVTYIDTLAERRKAGMRGSFPLKLLEAVSATLERKERVLLLLPWKDTRDTEIEMREVFPKARTRLKVSPIKEHEDYAKFGLVALLQADYLCGRQDFRADEKAWQTISRLQTRCTSPLIIQGAEILGRLGIDAMTGLGMDPARLLAERREFGYPPFSRLIEVKVNDANEARRAKMTAVLMRELGGLQVFLPKDAALAAHKAALAAHIARLESDYNYPGHIILDVDPS